jgi:hypothetical protein
LRVRRRNHPAHPVATNETLTAVGMAQDHRIQQQRFELKYLISEKLSQPIRDFVSSYLELDDFAVGRPNNSYEIHSVYFDSDGLLTHRASVNGDKNRFKLRLRYYDDHPDSPVFCEVKQRVDHCILKRRCAVRRATVPLVMAGQMPERDQLIAREPRHLVAMQGFNELLLRLNASPRLHNHYQREAWVSPHDNSVRVTLDRNIRVEPYFGDQAVVSMTQPTRIYREFVVLEIKFTGRFPKWFNTMVNRFNLMRAAAMKYSGGVELMGEHKFVRRNPAADGGAAFAVWH